MTEEQKLLWNIVVKAQTPEGYFHIPLEPKGINEMTDEEFDRYLQSIKEQINNKQSELNHQQDFLKKKSKR